jgi:ribosomal protein S18 acetylase RimI-like enzyme
LIGRLARDISVKGQGVGDTLVLHAFRDVVEASAKFGIRIILVDAKNEAAKNFYSKFGFKKTKTSSEGVYPMRLYVSVETVRASLS